MIIIFHCADEPPQRTLLGLRVHRRRRFSARNGRHSDLLRKLRRLAQGMVSMCWLFLLLLQQSIRHGASGQQRASSTVTHQQCRFKKYIRTCGPGLHYVNAMTEEMVIIDCRISVAALPSQRLMTRGKTVKTKTISRSM